jgi:catechol 2,3-dioxygenase-like lactoylglutathione lyase family enzyme
MKVAQSLDHFVVPVDDLVIAEEFYVRVFGGRITRRNGLNVRQRKRGAVPHTFIQIGGKRMGVYLQSEERPQPAGARGLPTYSFTTTERGLEEIVKDLNDLGVRFDGPVQNAHSFAKQTLFLTDPAGNHYAVYIPQASIGVSSAPTSRMTAVGYLELEAPDVDVSIDFYEKVLGFEMQTRSENPKGYPQQAMLKMVSGQTLMLTEAPFSSKGLVMSRKVPGPHIAFYVPAANWNTALTHLDTLGISHGDRGAAKERHEGQGGTYMDDPAGYVIQFITDGME